MTVIENDSGSNNNIINQCFVRAIWERDRNSIKPGNAFNGIGNAKMPPNDKEISLNPPV